MKVLVLCDDRWHPALTPRTGLAALGDCGFEFDWIENANEWSATRMVTYQLVLLTKSNNVSAKDETPWMKPEVELAFHDYVQAGNSLLAIHSGTAGYLETPTLRALLGGVFVRHPPQCQVTIEPKAGHALVTGSDAFTIKDEHYFMALDDTEADVFLTTTSEHGSQPAGWTRTQGKGRVCVLTPGHNVEVWLQPEYQSLLLNSLHWCSE
ncbi:MAG: ThuA domain-containing protein [Caldilineaceae bacterium]